MALGLTPPLTRPAAAPRGSVVRAALSNWGLWTAAR